MGTCCGRAGDRLLIDQTRGQKRFVLFSQLRNKVFNLATGTHFGSGTVIGYLHFVKVSQVD